MAESTGLWLANAETNDLTAFTATTINAGNTLASSTDVVLHGSYSYKETFGGTNPSAYGYYTVSDLTDVYARLYFRIDTLTVADNNGIDILSLKDGGATIANVRVYGTGVAGAYGCRASFANNAGYYDRYNHLNDTIFEDDTTYCIELHWKQGDGDGVEEFWIDNVEMYSNSAQTNTNKAIDGVYAGNSAGATPDAGTVYFDDVKANSSKIGLYSEASSIAPVVMHHLQMMRG